MGTLGTAFRDIIEQVMPIAKSPSLITEKNVFQEGDNNILPFIDKMVETLILPGSGLEGFGNLEELYSKAEAGKSCLLLLEHYSNMDLSLFSYLVRKAGGRGGEIGNSIIAIAGMKLSEENPMVSALASAYSRIIIYPSRSLKGLEGERKKTELLRSSAINRAALKALNDVKTRGRLILVFPSGTRYRSWDPSSKRGVREIDSYIKSFDYMCMVSINGIVLHVHESDMKDDTISKDLVYITISPVLSCEKFRENIITASGGFSDAADRKQAVADAIMAELEKMHIEGEKRRNLQKK